MSTVEQRKKKSEYQRKYRKAHPEKFLPKPPTEEQRQYHREYMRKYREKNLGYKFRERQRRKEYYSENQLAEQKKAREYMRQWYRDHKEEASVKGREKYRKKRVEWDAFVATQKCLHCGMKDPVCLDFHHRDPETKDYPVSQMLTYGWKRIMEEVDKCIVLCANCHRKEHARLKREAS